MEGVDDLGLFWLPDDEDDALAGRLVFDPNDTGTNLYLMGVFKPYLYRNASPGTHKRIHGWVDNSAITLNDCLEPHVTHSAPGPNRSRFHANELFVGHHLNDALEFDSVSIYLEHLDVLLGHCGINNTSSKDGYMIEFVRPSPQSADFERGSVSIEYAWEYGHASIVESSVVCKPYFRIEYQIRQRFERIQDDIACLESLVSICADSPTVVDKIVLTRSDALVTMLNGRESRFLQPIEYRTASWTYTPPELRKPRSQYDLLLTFEELGGIQTVAAWLERTPRLQRPISSLTSIVRTRHMFAENKFMNVTYAAEALHRSIDDSGMRMDQESLGALLESYIEQTPPDLHEWLIDRLRFANEPSLGKRLNSMAGRIGELSRQLVGDRRRWANTITYIRNDVTHLGADGKGLGGGALYYLTESVNAIARMYLLVHVGVPVTTLETRLADHKLLQYRSRIMESINTARDYLRSNGIMQ